MVAKVLQKLAGLLGLSVLLNSTQVHSVACRTEEVSHTDPNNSTRNNLDKEILGPTETDF
jgi:hypothetical protein